MYRNDRNRHGGGVFILVQNTIASSQLHHDSPLELVWVHIHTGNNKDIIIGSFYCPPHSHIETLDKFNTSITHVKSTYPHVQLLIGGDLNCPGVDWSDGSLINSYIPAPFHERLIEIADDLNLDQIVKVPTRGLNILDLCFTTHPDKVDGCQTIPGLSDHCAVLISFSHNIQLSRQNRKRITLFDKADWDVIREKMREVCENYLTLNSSTLTVEENWQYFYSHYTHIVNECIQYRYSSTRCHIPWLSTSLKRMIRKKQRIYNKAKLSNSSNDWLEYKTLLKQVKRLLRQQHNNYLKDVILISDSNKTFGHILSLKDKTKQVSVL